MQVKIYLDEANIGVAVCPECGRSKAINFEGKSVPRSAKARCSCGNTFKVFLEKRQHYRKDINVYGKYFDSNDAKTGYDVKIIDISKEGIRFLRVDGKSLKRNQTVKIIFPLKHDMVTCIASVLYIREDEVSCKIISIDEHSRKVLGFFLMP